jgi:hypothetical protein
MAVLARAPAIAVLVCGVTPRWCLPLLREPLAPDTVRA